eukprot:363588-Chlamydomonas_euryale.AAC.4
MTGGLVWTECGESKGQLATRAIPRFQAHATAAHPFSRPCRAPWRAHCQRPQHQAPPFLLIANANARADVHVGPGRAHCHHLQHHTCERAKRRDGKHAQVCNARKAGGDHGQPQRGVGQYGDGCVGTPPRTYHS